MDINLDIVLAEMRQMNAGYIRVKTDKCSVFIVTDEEGADVLEAAWDEYAEEEE